MLPRGSNGGDTSRAWVRSHPDRSVVVERATADRTARTSRRARRSSSHRPRTTTASFISALVPENEKTLRSGPTSTSQIDERSVVGPVAVGRAERRHEGADGQDERARQSHDADRHGQRRPDGVAASGRGCRLPRGGLLAPAVEERDLGLSRSLHDAVGLLSAAGLGLSRSRRRLGLLAVTRAAALASSRSRRAALACSRRRRLHAPCRCFSADERPCFGVGRSASVSSGFARRPELPRRPGRVLLGLGLASTAGWRSFASLSASRWPRARLEPLGRAASPAGAWPLRVVALRRRLPASSRCRRPPWPPRAHGGLPLVSAGLGSLPGLVVLAASSELGFLGVGLVAASPADGCCSSPLSASSTVDRSASDVVRVLLGLVLGLGSAADSTMVSTASASVRRRAAAEPRR